MGRRLLLSVSSWTAEGVGASLSMVLRRGRSVSCKKLPSPRARPQDVAMSCVARRTRSQTQKSSSSHPPAAFYSARRMRRVIGKIETVVISSEEDDNYKEREGLDGEEGWQSGSVVLRFSSLTTIKVCQSRNTLTLNTWL
ncbi:unnamed protein product [Victoria cruziana]